MRKLTYLLVVSVAAALIGCGSEKEPESAAGPKPAGEEKFQVTQENLSKVSGATSTE